MSETDVLIVGAGPAGLTLACDLKRRGVNCRIVEKLAAPAVGSKGKGIQPRSLELFDDLGVVEQIFENGSTYPPMQIYRGTEPVAVHALYEIRTPTPETPYPNIIMQPQWRTEDLLRKRLAELGGAVEFQTAFVSLEQSDDRVSVVLDKPGAGATETVRARYLVGTDGGRGSVRKAIGVTLDGETPALDGILIADVHADGLDPTHWHVWTASDGRKVTLCPLPSTGGAFQFAAMVGEKDRPDLSLEHLQAVLDDATSGRRHVLSEMTWISLFRPNVRMASRFRVGRVFLAGDAAHIHTPAGAQGMNTSVQDAYNLGWKLAAVLGGADPALLDSYEEERLPIAAAVLKRSDELYGNTTSNKEAEREPDESQLSLSYRGSSVCGPANTETALQPGDRMPGATFRDKAGAPVTLLDLLRGPRGVAFYVDRPAATESGDLAAYAVSSASGAAAGLDYEATSGIFDELSGRVVRIRPDGYIQSISKRA